MEFFEVGAQVLNIVLLILKGSHRELNLCYKLENKDYYGSGENRLYMKLKNENLWKFDSLFPIVEYCFLRTKCSSLILTELLIKHFAEYQCINIKSIKIILIDVEQFPSLPNSEKIKNCSNLLFAQEECGNVKEFVEEISGYLLYNLTMKYVDEIKLFQSVLYLEILTSAKRHHYLRIENTVEVVKKGLENIDFILLSNHSTKEISYRYLKVMETFIIQIMFFMKSSIKDIWPTMNKNVVIATVIKVIQKSNMKKPITVSTDVLKQIGLLMEENESDKIAKIKLFLETLNSINKTPVASNLKIRRNPESRLVIHSLCVSQRDQNKPLLHWAMDFLLNVISDPQSKDLSISSSLHSIEILMCDNLLQNQTLQYIPDVLIQCVELFNHPNWVVRNADLQLTKSLIERLFGVSMNNFYRPKNISDIFVLYTNLPIYFFDILSLEPLDERAVLVFQFFSESQVKENILNGIDQVLDSFRDLFMDIIKKYENSYGKLAVEAYVSLCFPKNIPDIFSNIENYISSNLLNLKMNILANLVFLMKELNEKFYNSYEHSVSFKGIRKIRLSWANLLKTFKIFDTKVFDYLLIKFKSVDDILMEKKFDDNLWVHNNLTFLFLNASAKEICQLLDKETICLVPEFFQIKMLEIIAMRYENEEFLHDDLLQIYNCLLHSSFQVIENNYLLNCYFKVLLLLQRFAYVNFNIDVSLSKKIYKNLLYLLYIKQSNLNAPDLFFETVLQRFKDDIRQNDDVDNDVLSTITITYSKFPQKYRLDICKVVFYLSLYKATYLEAYNAICTIIGKSYCSILEALTDFLAKDSLLKILNNENDVSTFVNAVETFLDENDSDGGKDEFYAVESEKFVPKNIVKKIVRFHFCP